MDPSDALTILVNDVRRNILKRLVREPHYPLQLAQLIGVSQQAIMKHLKVLEDGGFVENEKVPSEKGGPPRRIFFVKKSVSLRIDVGPDLFRLESRPLPNGSPASLREDLPDDISNLISRIQRKRKMPVSEAVEALAEIEDTLTVLDRKRDALIALQQHVRGRANRSVDQIDTYVERRIIHGFLEEPSIHFDSDELSKRLSLDISEAEEMLESVRSRILVEMAQRKGSVLAGRPTPNLPWWMVKKD